MSDAITAAELTDALDYLAITRLQARYGDIVTRRAWAELDTIFVPGAPIRLDLRRGEPVVLDGAAALAAMVEQAIARFEFFEFALLNSVVDIVHDGPDAGRTATGRLYMWELRQDADTGAWSNAYGLYRDTYVRHEGRWAIAAREYTSLARTAPPDAAGHDYEVFPIPD